MGALIVLWGKLQSSSSHSMGAADDGQHHQQQAVALDGGACSHVVVGLLQQQHGSMLPAAQLEPIHDGHRTFSPALFLLGCPLLLLAAALLLLLPAAPHQSPLIADVDVDTEDCPHSVKAAGVASRARAVSHARAVPLPEGTLVEAPFRGRSGPGRSVGEYYSATVLSRRTIADDGKQEDQVQVHFNDLGGGAKFDSWVPVHDLWRQAGPNGEQEETFVLDSNELTDDWKQEAIVALETKLQEQVCHACF